MQNLARSSILLSALALGAPVDRAHADERRTATDVADAPRPDRSDGVVVPRHEAPAAAWIPRVILAPVRIVWWAVWQPPRLVLWASGRYRPVQRAAALVGSDEPPRGSDDGPGLQLRPALRYDDELGTGLAVWARRPIAGSWLSAELRGGLGGGHDHVGGTVALVPDRLLAFSVRAGYADRDRQPFHGIGDNEPAAAGAAPVDPRGGEAIASRFAARTSTVAAGARARRPGAAIGVEVRARRVDVESADELRGDLALADAYATGGLPGATGFDDLAVSVGTRIGRSSGSDHFVNPLLPAPGIDAGAGASVVTGSTGEYARWFAGGSACLGLLDGWRTLRLTARLESTIGARGSIPFTELVSPGLRAYEPGRFRDRTAAAVALDYRITVTRELAGLFFLDTGVVAGSLAELAESRPRTGVGVGLIAMTRDAIQLRTHLAVSADRDVRFVLTFTPGGEPPPAGPAW